MEGGAEGVEVYLIQLIYIILLVVIYIVVGLFCLNTYTLSHMIKLAAPQP